MYVHETDRGPTPRSFAQWPIAELVSRYYRPPEVIIGHPFDYGIDMWALGATIYELATGKILFRHGDTDNGSVNNNQMLYGHQELKGKLSNKMVKKGQFRNEHFTLEFDFMSFEIGKHTQKPRIRELKTIPPNSDFLLQQLMKVNREHLKVHPDDLPKIKNLKDLLDRMLVLDPERRITPAEALAHPFITERV
jgi:serine/threonine-protein kinase PRP4